MITKVALGVFLGILLWNIRDLVGALLFAIVILVVVGCSLIYIFKSASNSIDKLRYNKDCVTLAEDLKLLGFAEDMGVQSLAQILQRYKDRWNIYFLISNIDKYKRRKANGYEGEDEREIIQRTLKDIIKQIKDDGWNPV